MIMCGKTLMKLGILIPYIRLSFLCRKRGSPTPSHLPLGAAFPPLMGETSPPPSEVINLELPEENVIASPEAVVLQDNADSS